MANDADCRCERLGLLFRALTNIVILVGHDFAPLYYTPVQ